MKPYKNYIVSFLISLFVVFVSMIVYHNFIDEPRIIIQERGYVKNIARDNYDEGNQMPDFKQIAETNLPAIVFINTIKKNDGGILTNSTGSGVFISPTGYIVTNTHVIANAEKIFVTTFDNESFEARMIGKDDATDIAVLKINKTNSKIVSFGSSDDLSVGEWVMLIGNPFKLRNSVSVGVISARNRTLNILGESSVEAYIQTDAMANPGNSGGGLFDESGRFIGLISAISTNSGSFQGYSFAIPSNIVKKVAYDIINYGVVQRAWLGVAIKNIEGNRGVSVERVNRNGAADECGLRSADEILKINGVEIENVAHFEALISQHKPGDTIEIVYNRSGNVVKVKAVLKNNLNTTDLIANRNDDVLLKLGFVLRDLTSQEKFELHTEGVMVVSVIQGSTVSQANIEPGFIMQSVNGDKVISVDDFIRKYNKYSGEIALKGIYKSYPGIFPYVLKK